jgi:hypothetical protein
MQTALWCAPWLLCLCCHQAVILRVPLGPLYCQLHQYISSLCLCLCLC